MAPRIRRILLAQETSDFVPSVLGTTQTAEPNSLLGGKADGCQGQYKRARPTCLSAPRIVFKGVPRESRGDGAGDEGALGLKRQNDFSTNAQLQ